MQRRFALIQSLLLTPVVSLNADESSKPPRATPKAGPEGKSFVYKHSAGQPREMEIYFPPNHDPAKSKVPGLIMFHGGGWSGGSAGGHIAVLATTNPGLNDPVDPKDLDTSVVVYLLFNPAFVADDNQDAEVDVLKHAKPNLPVWPKNSAVTERSVAICLGGTGPVRILAAAYLNSADLGGTIGTESEDSW